MRYVWIVAFILMGTMASAQQTAVAAQPEAATRRQMAAQSDVVAAALRAKAAGQPVLVQACMVAAAHPLAVQAGTDILAAGGTAADALVAVQAVLRRVAPQSSGLGGGAFLVWYDVAKSSITKLDGRETAPLAARARSYLHTNCAGCHQPDSPTNIKIDLRFSTPLSEMKLCNLEPEKGGVARNPVHKDDQLLLIPGRPEASVLLLRIVDTVRMRMPQLGTQIVDEEGSALVAQWIASLQSCEDP